MAILDKCLVADAILRIQMCLLYQGEVSIKQTTCT